MLERNLGAGPGPNVLGTDGRRRLWRSVGVKQVLSERSQREEKLGGAVLARLTRGAAHSRLNVLNLTLCNVTCYISAGVTSISPLIQPPIPSLFTTPSVVHGPFPTIMFTQTGNLNSSTSSNSPFTGNSNSNNKNASPFSSFNPFQLARQQQQPNQHNQTQQNPFGNFNNGGFNGKQKQRRSQNTNNEFSKNKTLINNNNQFHGSSGDFGFANSNTPNFLDGDNGNFNNNNSQGKRRGQQRSNRGRGGGNQNGGPQGHNTRINSRQNSPFTLTPGQNQFIPQQQQTPFSSTSQNSAFNGQPLRSIPVLPTSSGFKPRPRNLAIRPSYLEEEAASYTQVTRQPDIWDVNNQQELLNMEQLQYSGMDLESLYKKVYTRRSHLNLTIFFTPFILTRKILIPHTNNYFYLHGNFP